MKEAVEFEQQGYPSIRLYDEYFEVKNPEDLKWIKISYSSVQNIAYDKSGRRNAWWLDGFTASWVASFSSFRLDIKTSNGNHSFKTYRNENITFKELLIEIAERCSQSERLP